MSDPGDALRNPSVIGAALPPQVTVTEVLEEGGQGVVYKGLVSGELAAVKVYRPGQIQKRIDREVAALVDLNCASIVRLLWSWHDLC
jgi:serine/threonine protein kinase